MLEYLKILKTIIPNFKRNMPSVDYQNLVQNIQTIDSEFRTFNRQDASNPDNQRKLRACISLMHAELETYFEIIAQKVIESYELNRLPKNQKGKLSYTIALYNIKAYEGSLDNLTDRLNGCISLYKQSVSQNNGIKEKDILKILLPIGFPFANIDSTWLSTVNSFGALRGELIHKNLNQISKLIGYHYIDENVYRIILPGTERIDTYIVSNYRVV